MLSNFVLYLQCVQSTQNTVLVIHQIHQQLIYTVYMYTLIFQRYLGPEFQEVVLSGGDQLTTERETCCKRYVMDADTRYERLEQLELCAEDCHALMCLLEVL